MKQSTKYLKICCNLAWAFALIFVLVFVMPRLLLFFMPFIVGFILSLIANPVVRFLEKKLKIKRKYGTVLIIILVVGAVGLLCYGVWAALVVGIKGFMNYLPTMTVNAEMEITAALDSIENMVQKIPIFKEFNMDEAGAAVTETLGGLVAGEDSVTITAIGGIAKSIPNLLVSFQEKTMQMYGHIIKVVGGYFKAQFKIMGVIYIVITIGLILLKVNYAWLIGFGIAFMDMLPVFGTGTVLTPWAVIKFFSGNYKTAIGMLVLYVVSLLVHQLIQPKLIGESVGMNPFATLFFMYVGYQFSSVVGMIIAIPVGMLLINFYKAGAFDTVLWCFGEIVKDFNEFRKVK